MCNLFKAFLFIILAFLCTILILDKVEAQGLLKEDFTDELCLCLSDTANEKYYLETMNREDTIKSITDACCGFHFLRLRTQVHTINDAIDMLQKEEVENAYRKLAEEELDFVLKQASKTKGLEE